MPQLLVSMAAAGGAVLLVSPDRAYRVRLIAGAWMLAASINALAGWLQWLGWADGFEGWISQSIQGQVFGNLRQRNQFATLMNLGLAAALLDGPQTASWRRVILVSSCILLLVSANALSSSRTGIIGLLFVCGVYWAWRRRREPSIRFKILLAIATYVVVAIWAYLHGPVSGGARGVLGRLEDGAADCHSRLTLWHNVLHLISERPWRGWGWGELDYAHFATSYRGSRFCAILDNAHNLPLHLAAELGIPVALALLGVGLALVFLALPWHEAEPARQLAWLVIAVVILHSLVEYPLWYGPFQLTFGLAIGMLWPSRRAAAPSPSSSLLRWTPHVQRMFGIAMLAAATYVAWDYWRVSQLYLPPQSRTASYRDDTFAKVSSSWLFANQVRFAQLTITPLTPANAAFMHELAERMLHFSPEPAVIEKYIESARLLGRDAGADWAEQRYAAAFPAEHARWKNALSAAR
jgi:hypothetical protein